MDIAGLSGFEARAIELYNTVPQLKLEHVALAVIAGGIAYLCALFEMRVWPRIKAKWTDWRFAKSEVKRKAQRTKEAMDKREVQLRHIAGRILSDGLLDAEFDGKLSWQEVKKLCQEFSIKLNMPELVPAKVRADIVKQEIKARFYGVETFYKDGIAYQRPFYKRTAEEIAMILHARKVRRETPPPLPETAQVVVKAATSKYWKPKPVAA